MRLSAGEGRTEGPTLCFPTLGWFPQRTQLIPVLIGGEFQRTCSPALSVERRESRGSGAHDTSDEPRRLSRCTVCECTLSEYKHAPELSARPRRKMPSPLFVSFSLPLSAQMKGAFSVRSTFLSFKTLFWMKKVCNITWHARWNVFLNPYGFILHIHLETSLLKAFRNEKHDFKRWLDEPSSD